MCWLARCLAASTELSVWVLDHGCMLIAPTPDELPLREVFSLWAEAEPQRFPLTFGGHNWRRVAPEDHSDWLLCEYAAAVEAASHNGWRVELLASLTGLSFASVEFARGKIVHASCADPIEAFIRAVVQALALTVADRVGLRPPPTVLSFTGVPVTEMTSGRLSKTLPVEDMRVWARLEPERFSRGANHSTSPRYRGSHCNVLAPAFRAMVVLQYWPVGCVIEACTEHGWTLSLRTLAARGTGPHYECSIALPDGRVAKGVFATPAPACVKAYLQALHLESGEQLSITPHPKDKFMYRVVAARTNSWLKLKKHRKSEPEDIELTGTFAVFEIDLKSLHSEVPEDLVVLERDPTGEEIEASVAAGVLPG